MQLWLLQDTSSFLVPMAGTRKHHAGTWSDEDETLVLRPVGCCGCVTTYE
jgi:hypothetical protein